MTATSFSDFHARVAHVKAGLPKVPKSAHNQHGGYFHATADDVYRAVRGLMAEARLSIQIHIATCDMEKVRNAKGEDKMWVRFEADIWLDAPDAPDESVRRHLMLPLTGPQTYEAAITYLQKQYLRQRFLIDTGEVDADVFAPTEIEGVQMDPMRKLKPEEVIVAWDFDDGLYVAGPDEKMFEPEHILSMPDHKKGKFQRVLYRKIKSLIHDYDGVNTDLLNLDRSQRVLSVLPDTGQAELAKFAASKPKPESESAEDGTDGV